MERNSVMDTLLINYPSDLDQLEFINSSAEVIHIIVPTNFQTHWLSRSELLEINDEIFNFIESKIISGWNYSCWKDEVRKETTHILERTN